MLKHHGCEYRNIDIFFLKNLNGGAGKSYSEEESNLCWIYIKSAHNKRSIGTMQSLLTIFYF